MNISIFGLGYIGAVTGGCLADEGHLVIGVDVSRTKVDLINQGCTPIIEKDLDEIIGKNAKAGRLKSTAYTYDAVRETDVSFLCVGTPSRFNGNLDLRYVRKVCGDIGSALRDKEEPHVVVMRSTIIPGTTRDIVIPTLEEYSGKRAGIDFGVCYNPEFLREGSAVDDFYHPPKIVIGEIDSISGDLLASLYEKIDAPLFRTDLETAEMIKYVDNSWHALKVGFANEVGNICKAIGIDAHRVMDIFCQDTKLNLSPCYLKPGFAFGGSCLPKDLRALTHTARKLDLEIPILNSIMVSNQGQMELGLQMIMAKGKKKVGVLGFSFKAGTDDLRESPMVEVVERLIGKGYDIRLYDPSVKLASLVGANRDYILNHIPHISKLMLGSVDEVLAHAETVIIGNDDPEFRDVVNQVRDGQIVVDFVRITDSSNGCKNYDGICW